MYITISLEERNMIKDRLENAQTYYPISKLLQKGFEWLESQDLANIEPKKYVIDGDAVWANVQEYETKDDAKYETHRKYIDIQYMIRGQEFVGVSDKSNCITCEKYDAETDLEFLDIKTGEEYQVLNEGEFLVFFPNDAHKPSINPNEKLKVKKVVVKVAI